jgi:hypothetical protein
MQEFGVSIPVGFGQREGMGQVAGERVQCIRSKHRVEKFGEVFTPIDFVNDVLGEVRTVIDLEKAQVLDLACGTGNFAVQILRKKLESIVENDSLEKRQREELGLEALMSIYGLELLADNVLKCRDRLLEDFVTCLELTESDEVTQAGKFVLMQNIVQADVLKMCDSEKSPIILSKWVYMDGIYIQREHQLIANQVDAYKTKRELGSKCHLQFKQCGSVKFLRMQDLAQLFNGPFSVGGRYEL